MSAEPRRYAVNASMLILLASLVCFAAAFCVAEAWLTKGLWQEWVAAGLALHVVAELA